MTSPTLSPTKDVFTNSNATTGSANIVAVPNVAVPNVAVPNQSRTATVARPARSQTSFGGPAPVAIDPKYERANRWIQQGEYSKAIDYLTTLPRDSQTSNAIAVCLLRDGQIDQAVNRLRQLVTMPGSIVVRLNGNEMHARNFATAILMSGSPSGALDVLNDLSDQKNPMSCLLRETIATWAQSLPFFRRLDWKVNRIEPKHCQVNLDFEPGELGFDS